MSLSLGVRLGPYEITAKIGEGGMGEVYRATDTNLGRQVAIKVLPEAFAQDAERLARFDREAKTLASLNHPNIAQIYGLERLRPRRAEDREIRGEASASVHAAGGAPAPLEDERADGQIALVMELVEGPTLADLIATRNAGIPINQALPIAKQIAEALEAAHEQGIIHRDLKPANVKVRDDGTVKVLDFGLAKAADPAPGSSSSLSMSPTITTPAQTMQGVILGTAAYMSPEQARGRTVDRRADIWAFGAVLYEMLTGAMPFPGDDISQTLARVIDREPDWSRLPPQMPPILGAFLRRCLHKDPKQRLGDIRDARLALEGAFDTLDESSSIPTSDRTTPASRWRTAVPFATLALGAIVAGLAVPSFMPAATPVVARFAVSLPAGQSFTNTGRQVVAVSPDGTQMVYVANRRLWVRSLSNLDVRPIPGTDLNADLLHPVFSPNGQWLAFYSGADGGTLKKVALSTGAVVTLCRADALFGMSWGDQGIVFGQSRSILRVSESGGEPEVLVEANGETLTSPQMLPGGEELLFTATSESVADRWDRASVIVQSLGSGERRTVVQGSDARYLSTGHLLYAVGGTLFAVPFDVATRSVTGLPVPVVDEVWRGTGSAANNPSPAQASVSQTGVLVYVPGSTGGDMDLAWLSGEGNVKPLGLAPATYATPRISPDGRRVAFTEESRDEPSIWVLDLDRPNAPRRLTLEGKNRFPVWSPDSDRLAFQSDREGDVAIYWQDADGASPAERLTTSEPGSAHIPYSWSSDGVLLFDVERELRYSLWALSPLETTSEPFGAIESGEPSAAAFSPDGRWVAFEAGKDTRGVFVQPFPATGVRYQLSPADGTGRNPMWSPDGRQLFYSRGPGAYAVVQVATQPSFSFSPPDAVPSGGRAGGASERQYDIDPSGRGFIIRVYNGEVGAGSQIVVVTNWFEELKRLAPAN